MEYGNCSPETKEFLMDIQNSGNAHEHRCPIKDEH
jgi:hypothetical protein